MAVGIQVRWRRLELGLSQERLARAIGVTFQQVQKYERGTNRMAASTLVRIAAVLGIPVASLFAGVTPETSSPALPPSDKAVEGLVDDFLSIPDAAVRRSLRILIRTLATGSSWLGGDRSEY